MNSLNKILLTVGSLMFVLASVQAACYISTGCKDADTNKTRAVGSTWTDSNCNTCSCYVGKSVATCLERQVVPQLKTFKKFGGKRTTSFQMKIKQVVLDHKFVGCPPLTYGPGDFALIFRYKLVEYFESEMGCCTVGRVVQTPPDCEAVLNKKTCTHEFYNIGTKDECTSEGPFAMVGK